jgi:hypothetical protein
MGPDKERRSRGVDEGMVGEVESDIRRAEDSVSSLAEIWAFGVVESAGDVTDLCPEFTGAVGRPFPRTATRFP